MHTWLGSENLTLTRFDFLRTFYPLMGSYFLDSLG